VTPGGARAFGLELDARFEIPGVEEAVDPGEGRAAPGVGDRAAANPAPRVLLELASHERLRALSAGAAGERIAEVAGPDGRAAATIDSFGKAGFALWAEGFGSAWVDAAGTEVLCAPADLPSWRWQRFLTGQVIPFVAVLRGLEAFHASAVVADGRAIGIVARSGHGKTTLALELLLRERPFLDDDVLVVESSAGGGLIAHPGSALANVREDGRWLAERLVSAGLGRPLGTADGETRVAVRRHPCAVPLGALFLLDRTGAGGTLEIERLAPVEPRVLLAATFNLALRSPDRLTRQLDVCAQIAETVAVFRVGCPPEVEAPALAGEILDAASAREAASPATPEAASP
jgi:hypothetical protein